MKRSNNGNSEVTPADPINLGIILPGAKQCAATVGCGSKVEQYARQFCAALR